MLEKFIVERVVSFAAVFRFVTQRSSPRGKKRIKKKLGGALRDEPKSGYEGDYRAAYSFGVSCDLIQTKGWEGREGGAYVAVCLSCGICTM